MRWAGTERAVPADPVAVAPLCVRHPGVVGYHCTVLLDAGVEGLGRAPAQLALDFARVDGVAAVVAGRSVT